jgi:hypothetical protein
VLGVFDLIVPNPAEPAIKPENLRKIFPLKVVNLFPAWEEVILVLEKIAPIDRK